MEFTSKEKSRKYSEALFDVWMKQDEFGIPVLKTIKESLGEELFYQFLVEHQSKTLTNRTELPHDQSTARVSFDR